MTFAKRKFLGFLGAATIVIVAEYVMILSDCVISGRVLGENALGAINLLMPVFSGVSFFTWLLAEGTSIVYSDAIARMRKNRAAELAWQGLVAALVLGGIVRDTTSKNESADSAKSGGMKTLDGVFRSNAHFAVIHTWDDILLRAVDRDFLDSVLGDRITWFSSGAHCGMFHTPEFKQEVLLRLNLKEQEKQESGSK